MTNVHYSLRTSHAVRQRVSGCAILIAFPCSVNAYVVHPDRSDSNVLLIDRSIERETEAKLESGTHLLCSRERDRFRRDGSDDISP